jgi:gliding motility-associated-like protein
LWSNGSEAAFIEPKSSGEYAVTVTNVCGSASDTINIEIEECDYFIFIPNAFTPDDDGINDVWKITSQNILSMEITVFDRWGDIVFYTKSMDDIWMGNKRDSEYYLHYGVYNYYIKYLAENGDAGSRRGHITLLR